MPGPRIQDAMYLIKGETCERNSKCATEELPCCIAAGVGLVFGNEGPLRIGVPPEVDASVGRRIHALVLRGRSGSHYKQVVDVVGLV